MKRINFSMGWGIILIGVGVLALLQSLDVLTLGWSWIASPLFLVGGAAFIYLYLSDREKEHWWAIIPGLTLFGLGTLMILGALPWDFAGELGGALFMGSISAAFWIIYFRNREHWWAIIPGGSLGTLAALILVADLLPEMAGAGVFFLGMGATFGLLYVMTRTQGNMSWALIPGGIMGVMGAIFMISSFSLLQWLWPLALIGAGLFVVYRALSARPRV